MACSGCDCFSQARLPSRPIERGRPGPGLLAHVLVNKYADHLPLYRQSQIFGRDGLDLDRSTLANWVGKSTALLAPLADASGRHVLAGQAIFADDTPGQCWRAVFLRGAPARPGPHGFGPTGAMNGEPLTASLVQAQWRIGPRHPARQLVSLLLRPQRRTPQGSPVRI